MNNDYLSEKLQADVDNGINIKHTEGYAVAYESIKWSYVFGLIFGGVLSLLQSLKTGFPDCGIYSTVFLMLVISLLYKNIKLHTVKENILPIIITIFFFIIFTAIFILRLLR